MLLLTLNIIQPNFFLSSDMGVCQEIERESEEEKENKEESKESENEREYVCYKINLNKTVSYKALKYYEHYHGLNSFYLEIFTPPPEHV